MNERVKALIWVIIQFIIFSLFSMFLFLMLFHIAIFGLPLIAFVWTFWFFSILWLITKIKFKIRHILIFALLSFFYTYFILSTLIVIDMLDGKYGNIPIIIFIVNLVIIIPISIIAIIYTIKRIKEYFPKLKNNVINDIQKIKNKFNND